VVGQVKLGGKEAVVNPKLLKQQFDSISRKYSFATNPALGVSALCRRAHPNPGKQERRSTAVWKPLAASEGGEASV
jgi:hypothetical protein